MGKIVVNKHYDNSLNITADKFADNGEIILSIEPGFEGIYVINKNGEVVKIGQGGSSTGVSEDFKTYLKQYYLTSAETVTLFNSISGNVTTASIESQSATSATDGYVLASDAYKVITDNELVYAAAINLLADIMGLDSNNKLSDLTTTNKDTIVEAINELKARVDNGGSSVQSDWDVTDSASSAYILNKPTILASGDVQTLIEDYLAAMNAKASCSVSPSSIYKGETTAITVKGSFSDLSPYTIELRKGSLTGDLVSSATNASVSYSESVSSSTLYYTIVSYNGKTYTASTMVSSYYPVYAGFGTTASEIITDDNKKSVSSTAKGKYTATATTDGVNYFILVPAGVTVPTLLQMGGAPFAFEKTSETINDIAYTIIKSGSVFNNGGEVDITAS